MNKKPFFQEDFDALMSKIAALKKLKNETGIEMGDACGLGCDWHDNAGFDMAQSSFELQSQQIASLEDFLIGAYIAEPVRSGELVGFGSKIDLMDLDDEGESKWYVIGSAWLRPTDHQPTGEFEDDPIILSFYSPLSQALIGKQAGQTVPINISGSLKEHMIVEIF
ncbi:MAG: transcription elongation factor GreA [Patescibacteria group bacterium]|jgi:transcription elongation GreA/GreB family factor|nr:transcription elongation factor GreA [Patescibacteria group bacterium]